MVTWVHYVISASQATCKEIDIDQATPIGMIIEKQHYLVVLPYGLVVRIPAFHAGGPGSIPGVGTHVLSHMDIMMYCFQLTII